MKPADYVLTDIDCDIVITTAVEGGIGYWSTCRSYKWENQPADVGTVAVITDEEDGDCIARTIDRACVRRGWAIIDPDQGDNPWTQIDFFEEDGRVEVEIDAGGADVIVQLGLFGEVVYG